MLNETAIVSLLSASIINYPTILSSYVNIKSWFGIFEWFDKSCKIKYGCSICISWNFWNAPGTQVYQDQVGISFSCKNDIGCPYSLLCYIQVWKVSITLTHICKEICNTHATPEDCSTARSCSSSNSEYQAWNKKKYLSCADNRIAHLHYIPSSILFDWHL